MVFWSKKCLSHRTQNRLKTPEVVWALRSGLVVRFEMSNRCWHDQTTMSSGFTYDQITPSHRMSTAVLPTVHILYESRWVPGWLILLSKCFFSCKMTCCTQCSIVWVVWLHCWRDNDRNMPSTWIFTYVLICHVVSSWHKDMRLFYN